MMKILSNHDHEVEDENKTCSLRHAWKTYESSSEYLTFDSIPSVSITSAGTEDKEHFSESSEFMDQKSSDMGNIPEFEYSSVTNLLSIRCGRDSETESVISDYSEMADPVKEHLANVQIITDPFSSAPFVVRPKLFRGVGESEEEFLRRIRKMNFLSLAQEFAELKKLNASALPFNLHEEQYKKNEDSEDEADEYSTGSLVIDKSDGENDSVWQEDYDYQLNLLNRKTVLTDHKFNLDCRNVITDCPSGLEEEEGSGLMDGIRRGFYNPECVSGDVFSGVFTHGSSIVSAQKSNSGEEIPSFFVDQNASSPNCTLHCSSCGSRDDICRKLAMTSDEKWFVSSGNSNEFLVNGENECGLELCYVNEAAEDHCLSSHCSDDSRTDDFSSVYDLEMDGPELMDDVVEDDILSRQVFLEMEARLALAQVRPAVDQQLKSEVQKMKTAFSNLGELPGLVVQSWQKWKPLSVTELQIIANSLCDRIEALNRQLVVDLLQRDDLHMVQDSMLVEIEDLTGRAREFASKVDRRNQIKFK